MSEHVNIEAEQCVLGAILLAGDVALLKVRAVGLKPEHFYRLSLGSIYAAMCELHRTGQPIDRVTVAAVAGTDKTEVEALAAAPPVVGNAAGYAEIVKRDARWRWRQTKLLEAQAAVSARDEGAYACVVGLAGRELKR